MIALANRWSRADALAWLRSVAASNERMLIGVDLSPAFPFVDEGAYFPGWSRSPSDARALWALVDAMCVDDPHLAASSFLRDAEAARYFRQHGGRLGDRFGQRGTGRLRVVERRSRDTGQGLSASYFNLVGAAQVGKSSLTGMRVLHQLADTLPIWPFDPLPATGPVLVEIYTTNAARGAAVAGGRSKIRTRTDLTAALAALGSPDHAPLARYDDHMTDAILTAAWLRANAARADLWAPEATSQIARTEGWTFGIA